MPRVGKSKVIDAGRSAGSAGSVLRFEVQALLWSLVVGVVVLPLAIWACGRLVIGDYVRDPLTGATGGVFTLLMDFLRGLASGSLAHWIVAAGPYALLLGWRLLRRLLQR